MATEVRGKLGARLAALAPGDIDVFFFTNGGSEANENAIKIARAYTGRHKILARYRSYHGGTYGAMALTGDPRRWSTEPGMPGVVHVLDPYHGMARGWDSAADALAELEEIIQLEGAHTIAAFFLETVSGTNGILIPPDGYLQGVRDLCTKHGILMVCDEVMAGFGRTGEWFAVNHWNVVPDIMTMAKGLTSAYLPLGAVGMRRPIAEHFRDKVFQGGLTYNSHPMSCAAALATLSVYEEDDLVGNARRLGPVMTALLEDLARPSPVGRRAPQHRALRDRRARARSKHENPARAVWRHVRRDAPPGAGLPGEGPLHVHPLAHVLHEPAALHHRVRAPGGVRDRRCGADRARASAVARQAPILYRGQTSQSSSYTLIADSAPSDPVFCSGSGQNGDEVVQTDWA